MWIHEHDQPFNSGNLEKFKFIYLKNLFLLFDYSINQIHDITIDIFSERVELLFDVYIHI